MQTQYSPGQSPTIANSYRLLTIETKFDWHGPRSGYAPLVSYLEDQGLEVDRVPHLIRQSNNWYGKERLARLFPQIYRKSFRTLKLGPFYDGLTAYKNERLTRQRVRKEESVPLVHYLYVEHSLGFLKPQPNTAFVGTVHQPLSVWRALHPDLSPLQNLDGLISLSSTECEKIQKSLHIPVRFIPYGVDCDYFHPPQRPFVRNGIHCLSVGKWMRDKETLLQTIRLLLVERGDCHFHLVLPQGERFLDRLQGEPRVHFYSGISDDDLRGLYQSSDLLVLPMTNMIACSTLLESLASGLPAVISDIGAARDYTTSSCVAYAKAGDPRSMANEILRLAQWKEKRLHMSRVAREHALRHFAWPRIAKQTKQFYAEVLARKKRCS